MSDRNGLNSLVDACVAPLGGAHGAGLDLAKADIASNDAAMKRRRIREVYQDSRNADWDQVYADGLSILREESKDIYALWAVLAPLLTTARGHGFSGLAASLEMCNRFLAEHWEGMYPVLPDGLNLRRSVLAQLASRWTGFAKRTTPTEADAPAIQVVAQKLEEFEARLSERFTPETVPQTGELRQLVAAFRRFAPQPRPAEPVEEPGVPPQAPRESEPVVAVATGGGPTSNELERAYADAVRQLRNRPEEALRQFQAAVDREPARAGKFRGRVYLGDLYLRGGHTRLARQMLTFLDVECGTIKLEDWEPELCAKLWATLYQALAGEYAGADPPKDVKDKLDDLFARVCRVDAKQAIALKTQ